MRWSDTFCFHIYNKVGFKTSSEYNIFPTSGWPMEEPRCMMCQETYEGLLNGIHGYIVKTCISMPNEGKNKEST